ncbi:hypothetical protein J3P88_25985 [Pseudomonas sp. Z3-6]|uniref:hypothetical protein n=1 Tax=Pseudomonas sp. Z3-6 TaxID=2817411 RepID=UPI003DA94C4C
MKKYRGSKFFFQKKESLPYSLTKSPHLQSMLKRLPSKKAQEQKTTAVEQALKEFAVSGGPADMMIPNYLGFTGWVTNLMDADNIKHLIFRRNSSLTESASKRLGVLDEMYALRGKYARLLENSDGKLEGEMFDVFCKFKLLTHYFNGAARAVEVLEARKKEIPVDLDADLPSCSQSELRSRLFSATERKEWQVVFKIIGRLKDDCHDDGELEFLEAMARFHSNDLKGCVSYASRVTKDHIDFAGAKALQLECLAYLGDVAELIIVLNSLGPSKLSPMFMLYLGQLLVLNAQDPLQAFTDLSKAAEDSSCTERSIALENDPFFLEFNRHSCSLALRLAEWLSAYGVSEEFKSNEFQNAAERLDTNYRSIIALQAFDPLLAEAVMEASAGQAFIPIVKRLLNGPHEKNSVDYVQALETQLRLGAIDIFVDNVVRLVKDLGDQRVPKAFIGLVQAAYVQSASRKLSVENEIAEALLRSGFDYNASLADQVQRSKRIDVLSSMGKLSYIWAEAALESAEKAEVFYGDAGMIALGFFRILEHELNDLLIEPLRNSKSVAAELDELWSRLGKSLSTEDPTQSKATAAKRKKAHMLWTQMIERLRPVLDGEKTGLELGPLHILLEKSRSTSGEDLELKLYFASKLTSHLNLAGQAAFKSGAIAKFIEQSAVEQYRNPPAHSRFVSLSTAQACKRHVVQCISGLAEWTIPSRLMKIAPSMQ